MPRLIKFCIFLPKIPDTTTSPPFLFFWFTIFHSFSIVILDSFDEHPKSTTTTTTSIANTRLTKECLMQFNKTLKPDNGPLFYIDASLAIPQIISNPNGCEVYSKVIQIMGNLVDRFAKLTFNRNPLNVWRMNILYKVHTILVCMRCLERDRAGSTLFIWYTLVWPKGRVANCGRSFIIFSPKNNN